MNFSFFKLDLENTDGYIGYPTKIVAEVLKLKPEEAIEKIVSRSEECIANLNLSKERVQELVQGLVGGGILAPSLRLVELDNKDIVVAEVFEYDFDEYINHYEAIIADQNEFAVPLNNNITQKLQEAIVLEYQQMEAYIHYSNLIFGFNRNEIAEEFLEHANDELAHIISISRILVNAGIRPSTKRISFQEATDTSGILKIQLNMEDKAISTYREIIKMINDDSSPVTVDITDIIKKENEHGQDLRMLLRYV